MKTSNLILAVFLLASVSSGFGTTRRYYIAAENVSWDYAPSGMDLLHGIPIPLPWRAKTRWSKTRFIEYTDASFTTRKPQPSWLGILGPVIRAEVGDTILVDFWNRTATGHNIHPHGLRYDKDNEGGYYLPTGRGSKVPAGGRFVYRWFADAGSGPGPGQLSSAVWWYHPHIDEEDETNAGLLGPIVITAKGRARPDGTPKDVDQEFVAAFMIFNEMGGKPDGMFYAINGYVFGNLPGLAMKQGQKVRWYLLGMGGEQDLHTPHWHGKTVTDGRRITDVIELLPASMVTVDMIADNPGTWMFHCQVSDHMESGMTAVYTIYRSPLGCPLQFVSGDFWNSKGKNLVTVKNVSGKPVKDFIVDYEHLLSEQYLHRPFENELPSNRALQPGQTETLESAGYMAASAQSILGWALFPGGVHFEDGTGWRPKQEGDCFHVFWREKDHPDIPALPPRQIEMQED